MISKRAWRRHRHEVRAERQRKLNVVACAIVHQILSQACYRIAVLSPMLNVRYTNLT